MQELEQDRFYSLDSLEYYAENKYILKWWSEDFDNIIVELINIYQWGWFSEITNSIEKNIDLSILETWKNEDPLCRNYAWYNIIMNFAIARAQKLGLHHKIKQPRIKYCKLCDVEFLESSLPFPMLKRLGVENLDYCKNCLINIIYPNTGKNKSSKKNIIDYLQKLSTLIEKVPTQGYGEKDELRFLDKKTLFKVLTLMKNKKPTTSRVKALFDDSWLKALIEANLLENNTRRTSRGTHTIAKDGHVCLSLAEKTIDDFLFENNIKHDREPHYPEGNYRADFLVNNIFIEYFGLYGNAEYDKKIILKKKLCKKHKIKLISIYPNDIISINKLKNKLKEIL